MSGVFMLPSARDRDPPHCWPSWKEKGVEEKEEGEGEGDMGKGERKGTEKIEREEGEEGGEEEEEEGKEAML